MLHYLRPGTLQLTALPPLALYIHLPWCLKKCPYCDFNSHAVPAAGLPEQAYIAALLADLEAGCSAPVGAIAEVVESIDEDGRVFEELSLRACVAAADGSDVIRASGIGNPGRAAELGLSVAAELLELGARELMSQELELP